MKKELNGKEVVNEIFDALEPVKVIRELNLPIELIPIEIRNFDINTALKLFKEALQVLKDALGWWERLMIFLGKTEAPKLSDADKVSIIKDIPVIDAMDKKDRKKYLANKLIK